MLRLTMLLACVSVCCLAQDDPAGLGNGIFRIYCAPCHGIHAQGGRGPDLSRGVFAAGDLEADLARVISNGIPGTEMSGFDEILGEENIRRIVAFLRSVNRRDNSAIAGDAPRG